MTISRQQTPHTLFSNEHECVSYLFKKRWPQGFVCPFCNRLQKETAPAYSVVCRYCRKQTSITAHTMMHGSKNSLISWMLVAWQFCSRDQGISAREIQRLMALSSYQTAWTWLQKIRRGAALAESAQCSGMVVFDILPLFLLPPQDKKAATVGIALEIPLPEGKPERIRFGLLESASMEKISTLIGELIMPESTLFIRDTTGLGNRLPEYLCRHSRPKQLAQAEQVTQETASWLSAIYRKGVDSGYLQSYLDEFSFRYNTTTWPNRLLVFEHLLTGLLSKESLTAPARKNAEKRLTKQTLSGD